MAETTPATAHQIYQGMEDGSAEVCPAIRVCMGAGKGMLSAMLERLRLYAARKEIFVSQLGVPLSLHFATLGFEFTPRLHRFGDSLQKPKTKLYVKGFELPGLRPDNCRRFFHLYDALPYRAHHPAASPQKSCGFGHYLPDWEKNVGVNLRVRLQGGRSQPEACRAPRGQT